MANPVAVVRTAGRMESQFRCAEARRRAVTLLLAVLLAGAGCNRSSPADSGARPEITIAAAANLTEVFNQIGPEFERATGIHPVFSFGSTAQLAMQIEHSAPFDVFAAADSQHVEQLERKSLLASGSKAVYALGVLALWVPAGSRATLERLEDVTQTAVRTIAIAKPELAPYGQASVETLQSLGIWTQVERKVVYAENINMARQYGASNNADVVFTAYSLVRKAAGKVIPVDERLHRPITQELAIVASSHRQEAARQFVNFLLNGAGRAALANSGYRLPR
jgi:molybdate transport system substrate-binding protein